MSEMTKVVFRLHTRKPFDRPFAANAMEDGKIIFIMDIQPWYRKQSDFRMFGDQAFANHGRNEICHEQTREFTHIYKSIR